MKKKEYILIGILIVLIIITLIIENVHHRDDYKKDDKSESSKYYLVSTASTFFTVEGCVNRYINSVSSSNVDNIMVLLDDNYISSNLITKDNVLDKIISLNGLYTVKAKKIYYETINSNNIKYYFYGLLKKDTNGGYDKGTDFYLIINADKKNNLYSVTPYDGDIFKESEE